MTEKRSELKPIIKNFEKRHYINIFHINSMLVLEKQKI